MQKHKLFLIIFCCLGGQLLPGMATAQTQKSLKETFGNLKKSFHPDKAFILPFSDSANEDLQMFLYSVQQTKGVNSAVLKIEGGKAVITVDTKNSMVTIWNNLEKEFRNRYTVTERTPNGFILADSYQTGAEITPAANASTKNASSKTAQKQNTKGFYEQEEEDAAKEYQNPDTSTSHKSIWDQQKDHAEKMRQRDKDRANEIYGKNNNLYYKNPENYVVAAPKEKGEWYVEYTINGKKVTIYRANENLLTLNSGKGVREISCTFRAPKPYKEFSLTFTDPAYYPDIRKFEFGKPTVYSKSFKAGYVTPEIPTTDHGPVEFFFSLQITPANTTSVDLYHVSGVTGDNEKKIGNITSGFFEVLYFESRERGILEAKFEFTAKNVFAGYGNKKSDVVVTDGRMRIWVNDQKKNQVK